jgi:hypothetical protein
MFGFGLLLASLAAMAYLAWRLASVPWLLRDGARWKVWAVSGGLWFLMFLGWVLGHGAPFPGAWALEQIAMSLLGMLFLCVQVMLLADLATGFGLWARAQRPKLFTFALLGGLCLSIIAGVQGTAAPEVVSYETRIPGLPRANDGMKVVALSDLHLGATLGPRWLEARIAEVAALKPDLVVLLGDVFEGNGMPEPETFQVLRRLQAPMGVWGVNGNHERHGSMASPLEMSGVRVLQNELAEPSPGLLLAGRAQAGDHGPNGTCPAWVPFRGQRQGGLILLSHVPSHAQEAARSGVGLMLSGHTHGGQVWPFGYLAGMAYPVVEGRTAIDRMTLIVNRGAGTWGPRLRLWKRAEVSLITLRAGA